jgi:hypothetical protein
MELDPKDMYCGDVGWILLAQDRVHRPVTAGALINLLVL